MGGVPLCGKLITYTNRRETMPFDLYITFAGMCTLVDDGTSLHVLLPKSHGKTVHLSTLYYEPEHAPDHVPGEAGLRSHPLAHRYLDLSSLQTANGYVSGLPSELFNMDDVTPAPLSRALLVGDGGGKLTSRVTVKAGAYDDCDRGGRWIIAGEGPRFMAIAVRWKVAGITDELLRLNLQPLDGGGNGEVVKLVPINGRVEIAVFHTPANDVPTRLPPVPRSGNNPNRGDKAKHFGAFYTLFDPPMPDPPLPEYWDDGAASSLEKRVVYGTTVQCIITQSSMEPE